MACGIWLALHVASADDAVSTNRMCRDRLIRPDSARSAPGLDAPSTVTLLDGARIGGSWSVERLAGMASACVVVVQFREDQVVVASERVAAVRDIDQQQRTAAVRTAWD